MPTGTTSVTTCDVADLQVLTQMHGGYAWHIHGSYETVTLKISDVPRFYVGVLIAVIRLCFAWTLHCTVKPPSSYCCDMAGHVMRLYDFPVILHAV